MTIYATPYKLFKKDYLIGGYEYIKSGKHLWYYAAAKDTIELSGVDESSAMSGINSNNHRSTLRVEMT